MKKYLAIGLACFALASPTVQTASMQSADQPTLQKDTLQITAWTNNSYKGNYDVWSWVPKLEFRVNGPIPSGSQLFVEFQQPGGSAPWLSFDCETGETQKGYWWKTECGGRQEHHCRWHSQLRQSSCGTSWRGPTPRSSAAE